MLVVGFMRDKFLEILHAVNVAIKSRKNKMELFVNKKKTFWHSSLLIWAYYT